MPRRRGEEGGGVRGFLCVPQDRRRSAQRGGCRSAGRAHVAAHRWGAAFPDDGAAAAAAASGKGCLADAERRVVGCGDFCVSPKIEGAALSGAAAAARVEEMIAETPAASL